MKAIINGVQIEGNPSEIVLFLKEFTGLKIIETEPNNRITKRKYNRKFVKALGTTLEKYVRRYPNMPIKELYASVLAKCKKANVKYKKKVLMRTIKIYRRSG